MLFPVALWLVGGVRWIALGLNGLLLLATPAYGNHCVVGVVAGMVIAAACWFAVARIFDAAPETRPAHTPVVCDPPSIVPEAATATSRERLNLSDGRFSTAGSRLRGMACYAVAVR